MSASTSFKDLILPTTETATATNIVNHINNGNLSSITTSCRTALTNAVPGKKVINAYAELADAFILETLSEEVETLNLTITTLQNKILNSDDQISGTINITDAQNYSFNVYSGSLGSLDNVTIGANARAAVNATAVTADTLSYTDSTNSAVKNVETELNTLQTTLTEAKLGLKVKEVVYAVIDLSVTDTDSATTYDSGSETITVNISGSSEIIQGQYQAETNVLVTGNTALDNKCGLWTVSDITEDVSVTLIRNSTWDYTSPQDEVKVGTTIIVQQVPNYNGNYVVTSVNITDKSCVIVNVTPPSYDDSTVVNKINEIVDVLELIADGLEVTDETGAVVSLTIQKL
jgi:hypothetical protein